MGQPGGRGGDRTTGGRGGEDRPEEQYRFLVHLDDGMDEAILNVTQAEIGWNLLGTYYLSPGPARVELTNESEGVIVLADAVKWVRQ